MAQLVLNNCKSTRILSIWTFFSLTFSAQLENFITVALKVCRPGAQKGVLLKIFGEDVLSSSQTLTRLHTKIGFPLRAKNIYLFQTSGGNISNFRAKLSTSF